MERFKVIERDAKTKAYSKEGLSLWHNFGSKRQTHSSFPIIWLSGLAAKEDPAQKEKEETRDWLNEGVDSLKQQIDKLEAEVEKETSVKKKTSKEIKHFEQLKKFIERHNYHIQRFELLIRFMDNDSGTFIC